MEPITARAGLFRFGPFLIDRQTGELSDNGRKLKLQIQPFQILMALLERPGEIVTREDLRQRLWPDDTFVDFDNSVNIAIRKLRQALNDNAVHPTYIETLPKRGYRFIAPVEPLVEDESATVHEGPTAPPALLEPAAWWRRVRARTGLALAALVVVGVAYILLARFGSPANAGVRVRPAVAILGFHNLAAKSDCAWVSTALSEMIASDLAGGGRLRTVPGESVARARIDLTLSDSASFSAATLGRIRKNLGADFVLTGSYFDTGTGGGGRVRLDLSLEDTRYGETIWTDTQTGSEADLPDLVERAGLGVRSKLGVALSGQNRAEFQAAAPPTPDAARLYAEGLIHLRQFDAQGARALLERAVATAPNYGPAHGALSASWSRLGYDQMARQEARRAYDLAAGLPRAERLSIEARFHESAGEWDKAIAIYRQLVNLFPDEPDYGLRCATAQVKAGRGKEALATVEILRARPAAVRDDAALDYVQSLAANQTGDYPQAQAAAARAVGRAENRGEGMLVADARLLECRELEALGRMAPAGESCEAAKNLYARAGDRAGVASATGYQAAALAGAGDHDGARQMYQTALSIQNDIGNQGGALWNLNGLANELWAKGDLAGARGRYEEALRTAEEIKSRPDAADARANIGFTWLEEGDPAQARKIYEHVLAEFREMANSSGEANALDNLGETLYLQGELAAAAQKLEAAIAIDRRNGEKGETADALAWSGQVRLAAGDVDGARLRYEESLRAWREMGEVFTAPLQLRLAEVDLETGNTASAEAHIRKGLAAIAGQKRVRVEAAAHLMLARVRLAEGNRDAARQEVEHAAPLFAADQSRVHRLEFAILAARVQPAGAAKKEAPAAAKALETAAAEAHRFGLAGLQFEAQLALADMELATGKRGSGLGRLQRLERDAQARGYLTMARSARSRQEKAE